MQVVHAHEVPPDPLTCSIFLAGPTPRDAATPSWRPEALRLLAARGFTGAVFVPEPRDGAWTRDYDGQIEWEEAHLHMADVVARLATSYKVQTRLAIGVAVVLAIDDRRGARAGRGRGGAPRGRARRAAERVADGDLSGVVRGVLDEMFAARQAEDEAWLAERGRCRCARAP